MGPEQIIATLKRYGVTHDRVAEAIGRDRTVATKLLGGTRRIQAAEIAPLMALATQAEREAGDSSMEGDLTRDYLPVEILPTFAGMGGGGTGDAPTEYAMLPRRLVVDELRAQPGDLMVITLRGNSMLPDFRHDDQVVVDKRDRNPVQPGPFALWDGDGYVVKNVERLRGKYRIFSSNKDYSEFTADPEDIQIIGRPVWYARRL